MLSDRKIYVLKAGTRSTLNVRTFNTKRAHVLDKMCARFFQTIRKVKIHTTAVTLIASLSDTFFYYITRRLTNR